MEAPLFRHTMQFSHKENSAEISTNWLVYKLSSPVFLGFSPLPLCALPAFPFTLLHTLSLDRFGLYIVYIWI